MTSTAFHERPFAQRFSAMGDRAEGAFLAVNPNAHRLGVNRPALNMKIMPATLRYTPDFMLEDGLYEVMGCASRGNAALSLKFEKLDALREWDKLTPVYLWVFDSSTGRYWCAPIRRWLDACYALPDFQRFNDNDRPYWRLPIASFPGEPGRVPAA